jgi:4-nitrophenyl phosphatase
MTDDNSACSLWALTGEAVNDDIKGKFRGLILDMDGVLYRGNDALAGAHDLFPALRANNLSFILLTNNATLKAQDFTNKLARMGVDVAPQYILTSAGGTASYLQEAYPEGGGVYILGEAGLVAYVTEMQGFSLDEQSPAFVVAGLDYDFNYDTMKKACQAIRRGAHFIATNADATLPVEGGEVWPGAGSIVASLQTCSGVAPIVIGKPNTYMATVALDKLGLAASEVLCVGDRLETDILFGARAGIATALLLTGVSSTDDIATAEAAPTYVYQDLPQLMRGLGITHS